MPKNINDLINSLGELDGNHEFFVDELFNDEFIKRYTDFDNLESFMKATNVSTEELQNYMDNEEKLDKIALDYANFASFKDFIGQAVIDNNL